MTDAKKKGKGKEGSKEDVVTKEGNKVNRPEGIFAKMKKMVSG